MLKSFLFIIAFFPFLVQGELSEQVLVSVSPYKNFVEKIAGSTVDVSVMVPAGASSHTYEPTPREMLAASHADVWFLIGESFEKRAANAIKSHHPSIVFVDLKENVDLISSDAGCCHQGCPHHPNCQDLHIWLSPRQTKKQVVIMEAALSKLYPEHKELYKKNLEKLLQELDTLDSEVRQTLEGLNKRTILVSHPAYAYFCRDYNLKQLSIEFEGKDPTPRKLTDTLNEAIKNHITTIFIQRQYSSKGARLVASEIGAKVVTLDPYAENYFESMREIAKEIARG